MPTPTLELLVTGPIADRVRGPRPRPINLTPRGGAPAGADQRAWVAASLLAVPERRGGRGAR
jgi:hypothetical protein